jgi:hypothetical protein
MPSEAGPGNVSGTPSRAAPSKDGGRRRRADGER